MKRGMDKKKFATEIIKAIYLIDNASQNKIINRLVKRGFSKAIASDIIEGNALFDTFDTIELGVIADIIHKTGDISDVSIDRFLEEAEINAVNSHVIKQEKEDEDLLVFEDARQVANDIWTVVVPCQKIAQLYRNHAVGYDFETQRDPTLVSVGDTIIKMANVNNNAVAEIQELLLKGLFIPNTITFNISTSKSNSLKFDKNLNRLILLDKVLNILDGYHRSLGIIGALRENPNLDYNFEIRITNFDDDKARQFIVQEDKRNPINKEYIKSIDETDMITVIVNKLNQSSKSDLRGMITTESSLIALGNALVSFDIMYGIINRLWKPITSMDVEDIAEYLVSFFNRIVGLYPNEMKSHIVESRKHNYINREQMFIIYLTLAKELENRNNWKTMLQETLFEINSNNEQIADFLNDIPPSLIKHKPNNCIRAAKNIIEGVLKNEKKVI